MKKNLNIFLAVLMCFSVVGCGYSTRSSLPSNLRTIHVEPFKNQIDFNQAERRTLYIPLLEVDVRNAVVDRFLFDGNLKIVEEGDSDLTLRGELISFDRGELREDEEREEVQEFRIYISVNLQLWDNDKQELKWEEKGFTGEATYFVSGPKATSEQSAIDEAITDLARRIVERTIEDW